MFANQCVCCRFVLVTLRFIKWYAQVITFVFERMERVNVGMHVDIRRSDGRVHNAVISEVRKESLSVTVEWFENVSLFPASSLFL